MIPRTRSVLFVSALLACLGGAPPAWAGDGQIVFKLRASARAADPGTLLASCLQGDARPDAGWRPDTVRAVFPQRPARLEKDGTQGDLGAVYVSDVPRGLDVERAVALLAIDPRVEYAQPDHVRRTHASVTDPFYYSSGSWGQPYDDLWALKRLDVEHAWDLAAGEGIAARNGEGLSSRGEGIVVAVVDSGVDFLHPELSSRMWANPEELGRAPDNGYPGDRLGWDFVSNDNEPQDEFGHGTHIAGIIAAEGNGIGIIGVAPGARIMAVRAINGAGAGNSSTLAAGIVYAADNGAHVITVSSGCIRRCPSDPLIEAAVRHAAAAGAIVVVSAGNQGDDLAFYSPQNMIDPRPIVVASSDQRDQRESFSSFGDFVDLVAPGGGTNVSPPAAQPVLNILSLAATFCSPLVCQPQLRVGGNQYLRRAGTSMSAAYVSGLVALILGGDPRATLDTVRERMFGNAADLGPKGYDAMFGWGRAAGFHAVADLRRYLLARIVAPTKGQVVSGLARIVGAAAARTFSNYEIAVGRGDSPTAWQTTGIDSVGRATPEGDLATWNTVGLAPGTWTIRLVVNDTVGGRREHRRTVSVDSTPIPPQLVLDVASDGRGSGTVHVDPSRTFCDGRTGSTQTCAYTYRPGTEVTLTAVPHGLSGFAGWSGACSGTGPCTVAIAGLHAVRASFGGPYRLVVQLDVIRNGSGGIAIEPPATGTCGPSCHLYPPGTTVTLTGFESGPLDSFGFLGDVCGGHFCTLVMDRDWFMRAQVSTFDIFNPQWVFAPPDVRVPLGTPVTLTGYIQPVFQLGQEPVFFSWFDTTTGEFLGDAPTITVSLGFGLHDLSLTAVDSAEPFPNFGTDGVRVIVHDP